MHALPAILFALVSTTALCSTAAAQTEIQLPILLLNESHQGSSVSGTTDLIVTGAPDGGPLGQGTPGAAIVFRPSGSIWLPTILPTPPEISAGDRFGHAVAVNEAGTLIAVGAPLNDSAAVDGGLVTLYRWNGTAFEIDETLAGVFPSGLFGSSVDLDGDCLAVGEPTGGFGNGTVNIFCRNVFGAWFNDGFFLGANFLDGFGWSVGLDDDTLIVGSPFAGGGGGHVDIYEKLGGAWSLTYASNGSGEYGAAVAVDGDDVLIGAPKFTFPIFGIEQGEVHFKRRLAGLGWIDATVHEETGGISGANLGNAVALRNGVALVGGPGLQTVGLLDGALGPDAGAARVLRKSGGSWSEAGTFGATDAQPHDRFGSAMSFAGDRAVIGAPFSDAFGTDVGAAYTRRIEGTFSATSLGSPNGGTLHVAGLGGTQSTLTIHATGGTCDSPFATPIPGFLVLGFDLLDAPFKGGTLIPEPTLISNVTLTCTTFSGGNFIIQTTWPVGTPDLTFYMQLWVPDTTLPSGWSSSPGLEISIAGD